MAFSGQVTNTLFGMTLVFSSLCYAARAQAPVQPINDAPNPYQTVENFFKLPDGRAWGSLSTVEPDRDGRSIWVADRCGRTVVPAQIFRS
jgi:hypothetical protein